MSEKPVVVFVKDLIFRTKISALCSELGVPCKSVRGLKELSEVLAATGSKGILIDLNGTADQADEFAKTALQYVPSTSIVGFFSHVDAELAQQAAHLGLQRVMPRSRFVKDLPEILRDFAQSD